jgi:DNA repair exonuclease SbcCD ATPase subunit
LEIKLEANKTKLEEAVKLHDETKTKIDTLNAQHIEVKNACHFTSMAALNTEKVNAATYAHQIEDQRNAINPHIELYEKLLTEEVVGVDYSKLDELKSDLEHQKMLLKLLTNKDSFIRKMLIMKSLPFLNSQINEHSKDLGLTHIVTFNPDMTCTINEFGRELDYGNLSGGERNRLNLALSLAFRDMRQHLHSEVNILFADEVDAGAMDVPGVEAVIKTLKKKTQVENGLGIWIISHRPECHGRFDREMSIKFENGFSFIGDILAT